MGWQCAVQMLGLVRSDGMRRDGKGQSKHRANAAAIVNEAFLIADPEDGHPIPYRKSASETYDRTRTALNKYGDIKTADGVMQVLEDEADKQKIEVQTVDKTTGQPVTRYRGLQSNTPIGIAVIFNPPGEITRDWSKEKCAKFISDCEDCLEQIPCMKIDKKGKIKKDENGKPVEEPKFLFRKENLIARAEHWDESDPGDPPVYSPNWHNIYLPKDQYGKYNGSMVDAMFFSVVLNRMFPQLMRERGWDIDDTQHTDWQKFDENKEYRREAKARIKKGGRSVNRYRADKKLEEAEAKLEEATTLIEQASEIMGTVSQKEQEAEAKVLEAEVTRTAAIEEKQQMEAARDKAKAELNEAINQKDKAIEAKQQAEAEKDKHIANRDAAFQEQQRLRMGNDLLETMRQATQAEIKDLTKKQEGIEKAVQEAKQTLDTVRKEATDANQERDNAKRAAAEEQEGLKAAREQARQETDALTAQLEAIRAQTTGAKHEKEALEDTIATLKVKSAAAKAEVDQEVEGYRTRLMDQVKRDANEAMQAEKERIKEAWVTWGKNRAKQIIQDAEKAAEGEHEFLIRWLSKMTVKSGPSAGRTYLEIARGIHLQEIREERLKTHSQATKDAVKKAEQKQDGKDGKNGLGE